MTYFFILQSCMFQYRVNIKNQRGTIAVLVGEVRPRTHTQSKATPTP
jgi:hypothetical protein